MLFYWIAFSAYTVLSFIAFVLCILVLMAGLILPKMSTRGVIFYSATAVLHIAGSFVGAFALHALRSL